MSGSGGNGEPSLGTIFQGVVGIVRGDRGALRHFGRTERSFLISLAPIAAFVVIGSQTSLVGGHVTRALTELLASTCALLMPAVVSQWFAERWGLTDRWLRFATAFNWCQFALMVCVLLAVTVGGILLGHGIGVMVAFCLGLYALWLHWFLVRHGLGVSSGRAAGVVVCVHIATTLVILIPRAFAAALRT